MALQSLQGHFTSGQVVSLIFTEQQNQPHFFRYQTTPHLPLTKTVLGAGPQGETVIFEFNKNKPEETDRLIKTYQR